jgi:ubiquinone biosynthesis protein COQ4
MTSIPLPSYDFPRAARALRRLLDDPDDLPQVFTLINSVAGTAPLRLLWGFRRRAEGRRLLQERPDITRQLCDREYLRSLPAGSVGRAYLAFIESENISPEGIKQASVNGIGEPVDTGDMLYVKERMRDTHDLWHTVTGYKGDVAGEIGLLAFILAQNFHLGIAFIVAAAAVRGFSFDSTGMIVEGYRRGRRAKWLPAQDWESMLARPLDQVREELSLGSPPVYEPVRTTQLRAQGLLA